MCPKDTSTRYVLFSVTHVRESSRTLKLGHHWRLLNDMIWPPEVTVILSPVRSTQFPLHTVVVIMIQVLGLEILFCTWFRSKITSFSLYGQSFGSPPSLWCTLHCGYIKRPHKSATRASRADKTLWGVYTHSARLHTWRNMFSTSRVYILSLYFPPEHAHSG